MLRVKFVVYLFVLLLFCLFHVSNKDVIVDKNSNNLEFYFLSQLQPHSINKTQNKKLG